MHKLCKVKTEKQIRNTLDKNGFCSRVAMANAMYRYCGEVCIARPACFGGGERWYLYDKKNRPLLAGTGWAWTWVTEWLDFDAAVDENDLTKILEGGYEK